MRREFVEKISLEISQSYTFAKPKKGKFLIDLLRNAPQRRFRGFWTSLNICSHWVWLKKKVGKSKKLTSNTVPFSAEPHHFMRRVVFILRFPRESFRCPFSPVFLFNFWLSLTHDQHWQMTMRYPTPVIWKRKRNLFLAYLAWTDTALAVLHSDYVFMCNPKSAADVHFSFPMLKENDAISYYDRSLGWTQI